MLSPPQAVCMLGLPMEEKVRLAYGVLIGDYAHCTILMAIDETSDKTARAAADELIRNVQAGGCVDEHLQDQVYSTE